MYGSVILYTRVSKKPHFKPVSDWLYYCSVRFVVSVSMLIKVSFELQVLPNSAYSCKQTKNFNEINHIMHSEMNLWD